MWYIATEYMDIKWNTPSSVWCHSSLSGYQVKHSFSFVVYHFSMFGYQINHSFPCLSIQLLSDAIPGKTLFLVFDILFLRVWISDETLSSWCLDTRRGYRITFWIFQERERMSYMKVSSILFFLTVWVCLVASLVCLLHSCFSWPPLESNTANKVTKKKMPTVQLILDVLLVR